MESFTCLWPNLFFRTQHLYLGASLIAQLVKNLPAMQETPVRFLGQKELLTHTSILGLPLWLSYKESTCNVRDLGSIPGLRRSPGEGKCYPLQYSGLENSVDCIVHGVTKSQTRLSDFHFHYLLPASFSRFPVECRLFLSSG